MDTENKSTEQAVEQDRIHQLIDFWFGRLGFADLPTSDRTNLWFGDSDIVKVQLEERFGDEFYAATHGELGEWKQKARGRLSLIILLDQFPRYIYRRTAKAFEYDTMAQQLCVTGIKDKHDQELTLIERVFFYMPLVHSENSEYQDQSIHLYQRLVSLSMAETTQIYELFHAYARAHFRVIKEFGRFPQRNQFLGRKTTEAEELFLKSS